MVHTPAMPRPPRPCRGLRALKPPRPARAISLLVVALIWAFAGCGTALSAKQEKQYAQLETKRDNEKSWLATTASKRATARARIGSLEKSKGVATKGALVCGAYGGGTLRLGKAPAGKGKGRAVVLAGGGRRRLVGGDCSHGGARLSK